MKKQVIGLPGEWQELNDDELIHAIEVLPKGHGADAILLDVVGSQRHFFVRQIAAKKIEDPKLLHEHWDDRHIGQILVRGLSRAEDVAYLRRLVNESRFLDVRKAAELQISHFEQGRAGRSRER